MSLELRASSVSQLARLPFDGLAIGGSLGRDRCGRCARGAQGLQLCGGRPAGHGGRAPAHQGRAPPRRADVEWLLGRMLPSMPADRPRHVLGIADGASIPRLVPLGCDTFDSCYATRAGRHGAMLAPGGSVRVVSAP